MRGEGLHPPLMGACACGNMDLMMMVTGCRCSQIDFLPGNFGNRHQAALQTGCGLALGAGMDLRILMHLDVSYSPAPGSHYLT